MTATYYLRTNRCECCERYDQRVIGVNKPGSSFWFAGFTDTRDVVLTSKKEWLEWIKKSGGRIYDDLDQPCSFQDLVAMLDCKSPTSSFNFGGTLTPLFDPIRSILGNPQQKELHKEFRNEKLHWHDEDGYSFSLFRSA